MYKRSDFVNRNALIKYKKNKIRSINSFEVKLDAKFITYFLENYAYS